MITELKPYANYKESGLPWIGLVPGHWSSERAKWIFTQMNRPVREEDEVVTCFRDGMVTLRRNRRLSGFTEATAFSGYQGIRKGDLVIHGMDAFAGAIGVSDSDGKGTPVYNVCQPRPGVDAQYYASVVRHMSQSGWILALAKGIRERSTDFRFEMFGNQIVPVPPLDEQAAIVKFLDWTNGRLERAIRAKRKVIGLLKEQKQAIIHRAVTLGLDPSVSLKPSAVSGVGGIPKHWEERRLRTLTTEAITNGVGESAQAFREDWPRYVRITDISSTFTLRHSTRASLPPALAAGAALRAGDILIAAVGATFGKAYVHTEIEKACFAGYLVRVRPSKALNPLFAGYWTESKHYWTQLRINVIKSTIHNFSAARVKRLLAVVPPIDEQISIVAFLAEETSDLNIVISRLEREIQFLREYHTCLVADVVTGKLDVREAAARLHDEVPLSTVNDEADMGDDLDIVDEETTT